jgi:DNA-binding PadR family transcriptional regulator
MKLSDKNERVDVCVFLCFILDSFGELPESVIGEIILSASPTEYFDIIGNLGFMLEKGLISEKKDPKTGKIVYYLLEEGKQLARDLASVLSPAVRDRIISEGNSVLARTERERSVRCEILHDIKTDRYDLNVKFLNEMNGDTILDLMLYAPDKEKAEEMRDRFLTRSSFVITRILNMFLKDDFFMYDN